MRRRKVILCVDADEERLSVLRFVLETNGYRVIPSVTSASAGVWLAEAEDIDMMIADSAMPDLGGIALSGWLKRIAPYKPLMMVGPKEFAAGLHFGDSFFDRESLLPMDMLDRVKTMIARKRGPRPGYGGRPRTIGLRQESQEKEKPTSPGALGNFVERTVTAPEGKPVSSARRMMELSARSARG